jgi:hypothetical protein
VDTRVWLIVRMVISIEELVWRRSSGEWHLLAGRRRMGRVLPDSKHPGMFRSVLATGRLSDMANLSWAKSTTLDAAAREIEWEVRQRSGNTPPLLGKTRVLFWSTSPLVRFSSATLSSAA